MLGDICNLIAAILCMIGGLAFAVAAFLSEPTPANVISGWAAVVGGVSGVFWIIAAVFAIVERRGRH